MAPKKDVKGKDVKGKDAKGKDAKGKDAKGKDAKGKGAKEPAGPSILDNEIAKNLGKLFCILLTIISISLTIICDQAYHKSREVPDALADLRTFMVSYNKSLEDKTDDEVLEAAEAMSQHVIDRRIDIALLKSDIESYKNRIKQGWRIYNRSFWYFTKRINYQDAINECKKKELKPIKLDHPHTERFLETQLERLRSGIWVPMTKNYTGRPRGRYDWMWEIDKTRVTTAMYWQGGEPNNMLHEFCAEIKVPCGTPDRCWNDIPCTLRNVAYCLGEKVEERWLFD